MHLLCIHPGTMRYQLISIQSKSSSRICVISSLIPAGPTMISSYHLMMTSTPSPGPIHHHPIRPSWPISPSTGQSDERGASTCLVLSLILTSPHGFVTIPLIGCQTSSCIKVRLKTPEKPNKVLCSFVQVSPSGLSLLCQWLPEGNVQS